MTDSAIENGKYAIVLQREVTLIYNEAIVPRWILFLPKSGELLNCILVSLCNYFSPVRIVNLPYTSGSGNCIDFLVNEVVSQNISHGAMRNVRPVRISVSQ